MFMQMLMKEIVRRFTDSAMHRLPNESPNELPKSSDDAMYNQDGLSSIHNHDFMKDPLFCKAYERGCRAAPDYQWHWRVHIGLWAAFTASKLAGDFVECGVNHGFLSSAIMEFLDWDSLNRTFYLLDTFEGMDLRYVSDEEIKLGAIEINKRALENGAYVNGVESVQSNFSQWRVCELSRGVFQKR